MFTFTVHHNWSMLEKKIFGLQISEDDFARTLHQHLNLIGLSSSILACTLLFNTAATVQFWCSSTNKRKYDDIQERRNMLSDSEEELSEDEERYSDEDDEEKQQNIRSVEMANRDKSKKGTKRIRKQKQKHVNVSL